MSTINIMSKSQVSKAIINRLKPIDSFLRSFSTSQRWQHVHSRQQSVFTMNHIDSSFPWNHNRNGNRFFASMSGSYNNGDRTVSQLLAQVEREKQREREQRKKAGLGTADIDAEDDEDYMGVGPLIAKLEKENQKTVDPRILNMREEPTDSESEEDDHRFTYEAIQKRQEIMAKKLKRHEELLREYNKSENIDDAFKLMYKIDKFEEKHLPLRPEYRVLGDLMNRLKVATGKEKFLLQQKLNRGIRLVKWKEAYDPNNPANYGVIQNMQSQYDQADDYDAEKDKLLKGPLDEDDEEEFDDMKEADNILLEKINVIDRQLEEKLAQLDHTFGRKGKVLEEEIKDLAEERNSLTEKKRIPLFRKGFDVKLINVNRTTKVTKGGRLFKYTVMLACGNYHGVIGFAKAKGPAIPSAVQKAQEKCFQNLHYVERHEDHTIAHAIQTSYKKTKVYLWPGPIQGGMKAGRTVQTILNLAGYKNVKSKVVGSRNPHNTVKALFKGLNAIETPKDVQEKFGRVVVESHLL